MRIRSEVKIIASDDTGGRQLLFGGPNRTDEIIIDNMQRLVSGKLSIATADNEDVPLGDVDTMQAIFIEVDRTCTLVLNGGAETFTLVPHVVTSRARFFFEGTLSQVNISNPDVTNALTGTYVVWGDLTS